MNSETSTLLMELTQLRAGVRRIRTLLGVCGLALAVAAVVGVAGNHPRAAVADEIRAKKFVLVDDAGNVRAMLHQDPTNTDRRSRAAGLTIYDDKGDERGGFCTMADGSVVLGMDSPAGVGAPMRDRIGLLVAPDGSSSIMLIDNRTCGVVKLVSDESSDNDGIQLFKWDLEGKKIHIRTVNHDGEKVVSRDL